MLFSRNPVVAVTLTSLVLCSSAVAAKTKKERYELTDEEIGDRNRFWKHAVTEQSLIHDGVNHYHNIQGCIQNSMTEQELNDIATATSANRRARLMLEDEANGNVHLVVVENAIHPVHAKAVQSLASCVRTFLPHLYESRAMYKEMDLDEDPGLGGNCPTHLAPLVGVFLPEVIAEMDKTLNVAYEAAGWEQIVESDAAEEDWPRSGKLYPPSQVGIRASEHLTYSDFPTLSDHTDGDATCYTMNFAFSGPEDYEGGEFFIASNDLKKKRKYQHVKPNRYEAMVFLGGRYLHGVEEIKGGHREMFSTEFWPYPDAPFGSNLWSNFPGNMEQHIRACNLEALEGNTGPCKAEYSKATPFHDSIDEVVSKYGAKNKETTEQKPKSEGLAAADIPWKGVLSLRDFGPYPKPLDGINRAKADRERPNRVRPSELNPAKVILHDREGNLYDMDDFFYSAEEEPDFLIPKNLKVGQMEPIRWREDFSPVDGSDGETFVIGFPKELHEEFTKYIANNGMMQVAHRLLYKEKEFEPYEQRIYTLDDGERWTAMIQGTWDNDMIWLDPGDESAFESLLGVLRRGGFDKVLEQVGKTFDLDGLMIQGVGAIFISENHKTDNMHMDIPGSRGSFYNIIVPVHIPEGEVSMFKLADAEDDATGALKLDPNVGVVLGGESRHGTGECNYRKKEEFRLSFAIYVADIDDANVDLIASDSTSLWPTEGDTFWFQAQKGRLWTRDGKHSLQNDQGRLPLYIEDDSEECATMDKKKCMTDLKGLRLLCPKTCELYLEDDIYYAKYFPNSERRNISKPATCQEDANHPTCENSATA
ncbi:hypothetical protein IV203_013865 [Nitzschia inconspicua]|uniref:Fe2OG dioxygenase domain-containing protein n=1 Tax=Nitzschia inconspicua TaxID=303405 RepID=A0A9K3Q946_9STRA|nr:hypothetical protein IV203_013865 [Nitzschia inconspicua]